MYAVSHGCPYYVRASATIEQTRGAFCNEKFIPAEPHNALVRPYNAPVRACEVLVELNNITVWACNVVVAERKHLG